MATEEEDGPKAALTKIWSEAPLKQFEGVKPLKSSSGKYKLYFELKNILPPDFSSVNPRSYLTNMAASVD